MVVADARTDSIYYVMGRGYVHEGMIEEAREAFVTCCKDDTLRMAYFYAKSGAREEARDRLKATEGSILNMIRSRTASSPRGGQFNRAFTAAVTYAALGEIDEAFLWLEHAREAASWGIGTMLPDPDLDPLCSDPRFETMAAEMGMDPWGRLR